MNAYADGVVGLDDEDDDAELEEFLNVHVRARAAERLPPFDPPSHSILQSVDPRAEPVVLTRADVYGNDTRPTLIIGATKLPSRSGDHTRPSLAPALIARVRYAGERHFQAILGAAFIAIAIAGSLLMAH